MKATSVDLVAQEVAVEERGREWEREEAKKREIEEWQRSWRPQRWAAHGDAAAGASFALCRACRAHTY